jgi:hypothetical protein
MDKSKRLPLADHARDGNNVAPASPPVKYENFPGFYKKATFEPCH